MIGINWERWTSTAVYGTATQQGEHMKMHEYSGVSSSPIVSVVSRFTYWRQEGPVSLSHFLLPRPIEQLGGTFASLVLPTLSVTDLLMIRGLIYVFSRLPTPTLASDM